ncbi:MFS transporter [Stackebrandtia nassauensis]|uniref:Major facilitator superfamily MFS_1 n=1 Tax=Stackebrandtia nassauensis (strain DSM 44728 / CIP 108903 / NRRL B-16338 / NBRC 102104 / LLR-40K-21) TaxID=446470 RepID=D3Q9M0_STANL|nr:MFS transporter [Stackebrandtia nassauensis]ADD44566.1 major facilitator superfamily MFS_1 [Stackebrandtia nassauensis DSM 44728]
MSQAPATPASAPGPARADAPPARPAYRDGAYLRYTAGQSISIVGDQVWYVALSWAAVQLASPAVAGLIMTVSALPRLILLLLGGVYVDRFGPKKLMIGSDLLRVVVSLTAAAIALAAPSIALLVVVGLVFGIVSAVFMPAAGAMGPLLLSKEQQTAGVALRELSGRIALTVGAPLGGLLVAVGGLSLAATVDAFTFALSAWTLWSLRPRQAAKSDRPPAPTGAALKEGLSYLWNHGLVRNLMLAGLLVNLGFVGPMNVGLALLSEARGWGAGGIGYMLAGFGGGAAVSALILLRFKPRRATGLIIAACAALQAVAVFALAVVPTVWLAVAATSATGLVSGVMGVLMGSLVQVNTDDAYRGRVSSVSTVLNYGITPLAVAGSGIAVATAGMTATFAVSAALILAGGLACVARRDLRTAQLP